ncbi:MAG TPA: hypothetical protein VH643_21145 [Gemmataceae bacterium]
MTTPPNCSAPKSDEVLIVFRPLACEVPTAIRVRQLLKTALRRDRLRVVRVEMPEEQVSDEGGTDE